MCFPHLQPEEMTRLRSMNRQLQIDIDCTLKETDLLQSRGIQYVQAHTRAYACEHTHKIGNSTHKPLKCASDLFASISEEPRPGAERAGSKVMD